MSLTVAQVQRELADREAIRDCLYRYARGIDRCDAEMLRSAYWDDAVDNHLDFTGTREELVAWAMPALGAMDQTQHIIANILIRLHEGDSASVESYFYGFHRVPDGAGGFRDTIGAGRYVDRFEKREDEWRIARRIVLTDWFRDYPDSADWERGPFGMAAPKGGRFPGDASYSAIQLV